MRLIKNILIGLFAIFLAGCSSYKESIYFRSDEGLDSNVFSGELYESRIMPKDELTIVVSTSDPASSVPFYRKIGQSKDYPTMTSGGIGDVKLFNYLVDNEGYINYPVLGKLHVLELTTRQCEALICEKLQTYLNEEPNVTVRIANFKVSVLGEVASPGTYTVTEEQVNLFQALALAGDMTLFSDRDDVQLLRQDVKGNKQVIHLDLTQSSITSSPYFYLQQNDVIYVKPTKGKVRSNTFTTNSSMWISIFSLLTSIASIVLISVR